MKKYTLITIIVVGIVAIAGAYFVGQNSKLSSLAKQKDLMQLQDNCHNWGKTIEEKNTYGSDTIFHSFTHYNISLKKCFVEITSSHGGEVYAGYDYIYDGETGSVIFDKFTGNDVQNCLDYRSTNKSLSNFSCDQFNLLRDQYMNN